MYLGESQCILYGMTESARPLRYYVGLEWKGAREATDPKITHRKLRDLTGWSTSHIYAIEKGKAPADLDEMDVMAGLYGVTVSDIIERAERKRAIRVGATVDEPDFITVGDKVAPSIDLPRATGSRGPRRGRQA